MIELSCVVKQSHEAGSFGRLLYAVSSKDVCMDSVSKRNLVVICRSVWPHTHNGGLMGVLAKG